MSSRKAPLAGDGEQGSGEASLKYVWTRICCWHALNAFAMIWCLCRQPRKRKLFERQSLWDFDPHPSSDLNRSLECEWECVFRRKFRVRWKTQTQTKSYLGVKGGSVFFLCPFVFLSKDLSCPLPLPPCRRLSRFTSIGFVLIENMVSSPTYVQLRLISYNPYSDKRGPWRYDEISHNEQSIKD